MDNFLFLISVSLSSLGVLLDDFTSNIFMRDLGIEFEGNPFVRMVANRWGYKTWILFETIVIIIIGLIDSLPSILSSILFFGLVYLVARGLTGTRNLQIIAEYRIIGIDTFKEKVKLSRQAFRKISLNDKIKLKLPHFLESLICLIAYILLTTTNFPLIVPIRSLILGLSLFFLGMVIAG